VRELEMDNERQKRFVRAKMEEMSVMQRRLRGAAVPVTAAQNLYEH